MWKDKPGGFAVPASRGDVKRRGGVRALCGGAGGAGGEQDLATLLAVSGGGDVQVEPRAREGPVAPVAVAGKHDGGYGGRCCG